MNNTPSEIYISVKLLIKTPRSTQINIKRIQAYFAHRDEIVPKKMLSRVIIVDFSSKISDILLCLKKIVQLPEYKFNLVVSTAKIKINI